MYSVIAPTLTVFFILFIGSLYISILSPPFIFYLTFVALLYSLIITYAKDPGTVISEKEIEDCENPTS